MLLSLLTMGLFMSSKHSRPREQRSELHSKARSNEETTSRTETITEASSRDPNVQQVRKASHPVRVQRERSSEVKESHERIYFAVDVNNLWHSCQELFGSYARVDYAKVLEKIKNGGFPRVPRRVQAVAYTITAPRRKTTIDGRVKVEESANSKFLESLKRFGYEVRTRHMQYEKGIIKPFHTDWDVGITVDMLQQIHDFDTFIIASGDGDYVPLLEKIQREGKRVEIYTFQRATSLILYRQADDVVFLFEDVIYYRQPPRAQ